MPPSLEAAFLIAVLLLGLFPTSLPCALGLTAGALALIGLAATFAFTGLFVVGLAFTGAAFLGADFDLLVLATDFSLGFVTIFFTGLALDAALGLETDLDRVSRLGTGFAALVLGF